MGNKVYGHYQRKQSKQDVHIGPDRAYAQKQALWELTKAKRKISGQGRSRTSTSCLANPFQTTGLPIADLPVQGHQETSHRPLFASRSSIGATPVAVCTMLLLANVAQAALPTQPESQVATGNRTLLEGALHQFAAMPDQCAAGPWNLEHKNPGVATPKNPTVAKPAFAATPIKEMTRDLRNELGRARQTFCRATSQEDREQAANKALEIIPLYHQVNPKETLDYLEEFIYQYVERSEWPDIYSREKFDDGLLRCLAFAQKLKPELFKEYSEKILSKNLDGFMLVALAYPDTMRELEGSTLSLSNIIEKAFEQALLKDGKVAAFRGFLYRGEALHAHYQNRIASMLSPYIKMHPYSSDIYEIIGLVKSQLPKLRIAAFQALTEVATEASPVPASELPWWIIESSLKELFSHGLSGIIGNQTALDAYIYFYQACIKNNSIKGLQFLWTHLAKSKDLQERIFLHATIQEFFNLPATENDPEASFEIILNDALAFAVQTQSIPQSQIRKFLMNAKDFSEQISPAFLEEYKSICLVQEETPLQERVQFLDDLLIMHGQKGKSYGDVSLKIDSLPDSLFKDYAKTVLATLRPTQTYYEYFGNRKKLRMFHDANDALDDEPTIIFRSMPKYYNAFWTSLEKTLPRFAVNKDFEHAHLDVDLVFGYVADDKHYRFYACDSNNGYAVWAVDLKLQNPHPYIVTEDAVYCVTDAHEIVTFDKFNGNYINTITPPFKSGLQAIHITADKRLFALYEGKLSITNLADKSCSTYQLPPEIDYENYHFVDDKIIFEVQDEGKSAMLIYDKHGVQQRFALEPLSEFYSNTRIIQGNQHMLWYTTDGKKNVTFLDSATGKKLLEYDLSGRLVCARLSNKRDQLFLLTERELIALDVSATQTELPRILWQTSIVKADKFWSDSGATHMVVADDDSSIYAIDDAHHSVFHFDSQTGAMNYLYTEHLGRTYHLLGTHNSKLYIKPISF